MKYETKTYSLIILPEKDDLFSEQATIISVSDEAGGVFFTIEQQTGRKEEKLSFNFDEWPHIVSAVEFLRKEWDL